MQVTVDEYGQHEQRDDQRGGAVVDEPGLGDEVKEPSDVEQQKDDYQIEQNDEKRVAEVVEPRGNVQRQPLERTTKIQEYAGKSQQPRCQHTTLPRCGPRQHLPYVPGGIAHAQ